MQATARWTCCSVQQLQRAFLEGCTWAFPTGALPRSTFCACQKAAVPHWKGRCGAKLALWLSLCTVSSHLLKGHDPKGVCKFARSFRGSADSNRHVDCRLCVHSHECCYELQHYSMCSSLTCDTPRHCVLTPNMILIVIVILNSQVLLHAMLKDCPSAVSLFDGKFCAYRWMHLAMASTHCASW